MDEDPANNTHTSSSKPGAPKSNCTTPAIASIDDSEQKKKRRRRSAGDSLTLIPSPSGGALGSYLQDSNSSAGTCALGGLKRQRALQALRANVHFALSCPVSDEKDKDSLPAEADVGKNKRQGCLIAVSKALQQYAGNHPLGCIDSNAESENNEVKEKMKPKPKVKKEKDFMGFVGDCPMVPGALLTPTMLGSGAGGQVGGMSVVSCPPPISTSLPYLLLSPPVTGNMMYTIPGSAPASTQGPLNIPSHEDPPGPSFRPPPAGQYGPQHVSTPFHPSHILQSVDVTHHMNLMTNNSTNTNNSNMNTSMNNTISNTNTNNGDDDNIIGYTITKTSFLDQKDLVYTLTHANPIKSGPAVINHSTSNNANITTAYNSNNNNNTIGSNNNNTIGSNNNNNKSNNYNNANSDTIIRYNHNTVNKNPNETNTGNNNNSTFNTTKNNANAINTTNTNTINTNSNNSNTANNANNNTNDSNNNANNNASDKNMDDKDGLLALEGLLSLSKY
jgi:hypothetical protein